MSGAISGMKTAAGVGASGVGVGVPRLRRAHPGRPAGAAPAVDGRFPELIGVPGGAVASLARLRQLRVLLIGCGSVGRVAAAAVARLFPKCVIVVDPKRAGILTPLTGVLSGQEEVGRAKVEGVAHDVRRVSGGTEVWEFCGSAQELPLAAWLGVDAVILCADNLTAEVFVGERCHRLGLPLWLANVHGASLVAQVRCFGQGGPDAPCPGCRYGAAEWGLADAEVAVSCEGTGNAWTGAGAAPTRSTAHLGAIAGGLAANQFLRWALRLGDPVEDTQLEYCGVTHRTVLSRLTRRASCRMDHGPRWVRLPVAGSPGRWSVDALAAVAGFAPGARGLWVTVDGRAFVGMGHCGCGSEGGQGRPVHRFLADNPARKAGVCGRCGQPLCVAPGEWRTRVAAADLGARRSWSLRRLGAGPGPVVLVSDGERTVVVFRAEPGSEPVEPVRARGGNLT